MKRNTRIVFAIACLALAALACQAMNTGGNPTSEPNVPPNIDNTDVPAPTSAPVNQGGGDVVFKDDFSSQGNPWGTGTDADSSVEYDNETLRIKVFTKNYIVWTTPPKDKDYEKVHVEVTANTNGSDSTTAFGVLCDQQVITSTYYYFAITPDGDYAIAKAALAQTDVFLTNGDQWAKSDLITKNASSYRIGADCGNGNLTLYVDGKEIVSASDSTYTGGGVGVINWSGQDSVLADITFDDFAVTTLP